MIHTSRQLKDLVRNLSGGDSTKAQMIIRNYVMERFLERLSHSKYRDNLILKGGILIASMIGMDKRSTMDIDTTLKNLTLTLESIENIIKEILSVELEDGLSFKIINATTIMDEADYSGVRVMLQANLDSMRIPLKIDFSTGDIITPSEVLYAFQSLFDDRSILIMAYNLETILAEKLETLFSRGVSNTRMRDFYDLYVFEKKPLHSFEAEILRSAFMNTCNQRVSNIEKTDALIILDEIQTNFDMLRLWESYKKKFDYAAGIEWDEIMDSLRRLYDIIYR